MSSSTSRVASPVRQMSPTIQQHLGLGMSHLRRAAGKAMLAVPGLMTWQNIGKLGVGGLVGYGAYRYGPTILGLAHRLGKAAYNTGKHYGSAAIDYASKLHQFNKEWYHNQSMKNAIPQQGLNTTAITTTPPSSVNTTGKVRIGP